MQKPIEISGIRVGKGEKKPWWLKISDFGALPIELPITIINGAEEGPRLAVIAGCHGSEYTGIEATIRLARQLDPQKLKGSVVFVHVVNVPAFQSRTQYVCPLDGLNMSNIRPGRIDGSISHRILHKVFHEVIYPSDACMDLHAGDLHEALSVPFIIYPITPNDESNKTTLTMAEAHGVDYIWGEQNEGFAPGGPTNGNAPIPYIVVECGQEGRMEENYIQIHYQGVLNVMHVLGLMENPNPSQEKRDIIKIKKGGKIHSDVGGLFYSHVKPSEKVSKGDLIGEIKDIRGEVLQEVFSPADCMILMYVSNPIIGPGDVILGYAEF